MARLELTPEQEATLRDLPPPTVTLSTGRKVVVGEFGWYREAGEPLSDTERKEAWRLRDSWLQTVERVKLQIALFPPKVP